VPAKTIAVQKERVIIKTGGMDASRMACLAGRKQPAPARTARHGHSYIGRARRW
jgi:hypothetical protein